MMNLSDIQSVYFIGAGGIGMSAPVRYFLSQGKAGAGPHPPPPARPRPPRAPPLTLSVSKVAANRSSPPPPATRLFACS